jgi:hypothetical protein
MRPAIIGIAIGIITAISLKNQTKISNSIVRISLTNELLTIIILGLIELR